MLYEAPQDRRDVGDPDTWADAHVAWQGIIGSNPEMSVAEMVGNLTALIWYGIPEAHQLPDPA